MDILKFLSAQNIDVSPDKADSLKTAFADEIGKITSKLETERDSLKDSLKTAQDTLKSFEGVDPDKLKGEVETLKKSLAERESEYNAKISDMEFNSVLDTAISASKAKNSKALKALLDVENLKASKNQTEDIKTAIDKIKAENDYLFESDEPIKNPVAPTSTNTKTNPLQAMRSAMGLKQEV